MSIFNQFPWTNFREYNLDWVIRTVKDALENIYDTATQVYADRIDATLSIQGDAADAKKTGDEITSLKNRMTTAEGDITNLQGDITALQGLTPKIVILQQLSANNWSYSKGDFDDLAAIMEGMTGVGTLSIDKLGYVMYRPTLTDPCYTLYTCKFNSSYGAGKPAWDLVFGDSQVYSSVTAKWDGTFA